MKLDIPDNLAKHLADCASVGLEGTRHFSDEIYAGLLTVIGKMRIPETKPASKMEEKLRLAIFAKIDLLTTDLTIARDLLNDGLENGAIGSLLSRVNTISELLSMLKTLRDYK